MRYWDVGQGPRIAALFCAAAFALVALSVTGTAQEPACADQAERYRLEAEKWRLEYEKLSLEHELLRLELERCRGGVAPREDVAEPEPEVEDPGLPYLVAAMSACDLAWTRALLRETDFSCSEVRVDVPERVVLAIESAGDLDSRDGCRVTAASEEWNATSSTVWKP